MPKMDSCFRRNDRLFTRTGIPAFAGMTGFLLEPAFLLSQE
ncbi:Uncharacterized protein dnm_074380 [Desulfonema magnum]|uniref:Uncharacterized protein n=1 Tax=Desulfonema magnum TaxID=45655 RepID=A0A975BTL6_9BACT|nr:Uncharacterized protein dnm_074380 [Desulfonema magnum]